MESFTPRLRCFAVAQHTGLFHPRNGLLPLVTFLRRLVVDGLDVASRLAARAQRALRAVPGCGRPQGWLFGSRRDLREHAEIRGGLSDLGWASSLPLVVDVVQLGAEGVRLDVADHGGLACRHQRLG